MTQPGGFGSGGPFGGGYGPPPGGGYGPPGGGYGPPAGGGFGPPDGPSILGGGGPMPMGPGGYRPPPKKKGNGGLIAAIVVAVLLLGGIVTLLVVLVSKKPGPIIADPSSLPPKQASVAWKHMPSGCDVVMRANVAQMRDVPAVKTHLLPIVDEIQGQAATDPDAKSIDDLLKSSGIDAKTDLKDFAMCVKGVNGPDSQQKFLFVIAGDLRPETIVSAWEKVDRRTATHPTISKSDGRMVGRAVSKEGDTIIAGQAADGAIVLANDEGLFAGAAKESSAFQGEYALPTTVEAAVGVGSAVMREALAGGGQNPFMKDVAGIQRIVGTVSLAEARVELRLGTSSPKEAKGLVDLYNLAIGPMLKQEVKKAEASVPGISVLTNAKPVVDGNDFVLTAQGTSADVEAAVKELARVIREQQKKGALAL